MKTFHKLLPVCFLVASLGVLSSGQTEPASKAAAPDDPTQLNQLLDRVRQRIRKYHESLFSIAVTEVVKQQELNSDATPRGKPRGLVYDSVTLHRLAPGGQEDTVPIITRTLKMVDGKPAKQPSLPRHSKCVDINPPPAYADPLAFLLPQSPIKWIFAYLGETNLEGRRAAMISITTAPAPEPIKIVEKGDCFFLSRSPQKTGTIWIDLESYDVLQLKWQLAETFSGKLPAGITRVGFFPVFRPGKDLSLERFDFVIRFRPTTFTDPEQTLLLPSSSESIWLLKGGGVPGVQTNIDYTHYRQFKSRVEVKETDGIQKP